MAFLQQQIGNWLRGRRARASAGSFLVRVAAVRDVAQDVRSYELVAATQGQMLPPFTAGAHIDLDLGSGLVRSYSLCSDPDERGHYVIAVKRMPDSRGGSRTMHERVQAGDDLLVAAGPRNTFPLETQAAHHVLVAAGIGITPLLAMAAQLQRAAGSFALHYFARSSGQAAFLDLLARPAFDGKVRLHFALTREEQAVRLVGALARPGADDHLYVCGPDGFMQGALAVAAGRGWPAHAVHKEYFRGGASSAGASSEAFQVRLSRSRRTLQVGAHETMLGVLESNGFRVPTSCREGICGTCITPVLAGGCDHRDHFLGPAQREANDCILPCVSRARGGELVLDL